MRLEMLMAGGRRIINLQADANRRYAILQAELRQVGATPGRR